MLVGKKGNGQNIDNVWYNFPQVKNLPVCRNLSKCKVNPWVGKIPGEGKVYPFQYSDLQIHSLTYHSGISGPICPKPNAFLKAQFFPLSPSVSVELSSTFTFK